MKSLFNFIVRYLRLPVAEVIGPIIDSSKARLELLRQHGKSTSRTDVSDALSITSGKEFTVFQKKPDSIIKTIAAGKYLPRRHNGNDDFLLGNLALQWAGDPIWSTM